MKWKITRGLTISVKMCPTLIVGKSENVLKKYSSRPQKTNFESKLPQNENILGLIILENELIQASIDFYIHSFIHLS